MTETKTIAKAGPQLWMKRVSSVGKWLLMLGSVGGVIFLLMFFAGVFQRKVGSIKTGNTRSIPRDAVFVPVREVVQPRYESAVGAIKPVHEANVASKILARVVEVNATAGKAVSKGDILVRLSGDEQESRVKQADAIRESLAAELQLAEVEAARAAQLMPSNSISKAEYDAAQTRVKTLQAGVDRAERAVEEAKVYLDFATVSAPFSGIVVDKAVQPGDTVTPGQTLLTLYDPSAMQLVVDVRESLAMKLKVGQVLPARMESLGLECLATVSEVVPRADVSSRSFEVKVTGPCPQGVYSGMFGRLMLPLDDERILLVPTKAISRVGQLTYVEVVDKQEFTTRRSILPGRVFGAETEVLSGLKEGELILVSKSAD